MKKTLLPVFFTFYFIFSFTNCGKDKSKPDPRVHEKTNRTVLAYLVGDNELWHMMEESLNLMEKGWNADIDGTLLVYLDNSPHLTQFGQPVLLEITRDETDMIASKVVKTYDDQDAGNPGVMRGVLNDAITLYPADSHGLIIAGHGDGWLPGLPAADGSRAISGPERHGSTLEIDALAELLPVKYDFILFHACNMINAETAYQLRDKCEYLMGSVFALPGYGYPYDRILPYLYTKPRADLYKASLLSYTEYATKIDPSTFEVFSVEVIKMSELENLAAATSRLLDGLGMSYDEIWDELYREREEMSDAPVDEKNFVIDCYEGIGLLLDLKGLCLVATNREDAASLEEALNRAVILHYVFGQTPEAWKMNHTDLGSGISFYLPVKIDKPNYIHLNARFKNDFEWSKASGFDKDR